MKFWFVTVVPKYLSVKDTGRKLLARLYLSVLTFVTINDTLVLYILNEFGKLWTIA
jgi:hypothetical protein